MLNIWLLGGGEESLQMVINIHKFVRPLADLYIGCGHYNTMSDLKTVETLHKNTSLFADAPSEFLNSL